MENFVTLLKMLIKIYKTNFLYLTFSLASSGFKSNKRNVIICCVFEIVQYNNFYTLPFKLHSKRFNSIIYDLHFQSYS